MTDPKQFTDVICEVRDRAAWIIINRPKVYNAFRGQTLEEMIQALHLAANDRQVASIVLTGAGDKAFCTGGDQSAHEGQYDGRGGRGDGVQTSGCNGRPSHGGGSVDCVSGGTLRSRTTRF